MNIFVGNLSFGTNEAEIRSLFSAHGTVDRVNIVTDRETGQPRGFAFVEMANDSEAQNAINSVNGKEVGGRALNVNEARPKTEGGGNRSFGKRPSFGGGGGGGGRSREGFSGNRGGGGGGGDDRRRSRY